MKEIVDLLSYTFIQRAILCGIAISFSAALIGVILTLKNYSMIGHGLGEVGFAALTLAVLLNLPPIIVSIPIVIIAAIIIMIISQKKGESADIIIALVATGALALGVIITAFTSGFGTDTYNYMFGSILTMTKSDVILSIILTILSIGIYIVFYNRLFLITFDEKYAKACRNKCYIISVSNSINNSFSSCCWNENDGNNAYFKFNCFSCNYC